MRKSRIKRNSKKVYPHLCQIVFLTHHNGEERKPKRDIGTSADDSALPFAVARVYLILFTNANSSLAVSFVRFVYILCVPILVFNIRSEYFLQTGNTCACYFFASLFSFATLF